MALDSSGDATFHNNVAVTTMLDTPDVETGTVSARDGATALTITNSTGVVAFSATPTGTDLDFSGTLFGNQASVDFLADEAGTAAPDATYGLLVSEMAAPTPAANHVQVYVDSTTNDLRAAFDSGGSALVAAHPSSVYHLISASETLSTTNHIVGLDASGGSLVETLPPIAQAPAGTMWVFKVVTDPGVNTITLSAADNIDGAATYTGLSVQHDAITVVSDGTTYWLY
jgi:hypothetical protein